MKPFASICALVVLKTQVARIRFPPDGNKHAVESLFRLSDVRTFELHADSVAVVLHLDNLRVDKDGYKKLFKPLGERSDKISVCARQKARHHFNNRHSGPERRIDGSKLKTDIAAPDDQQTSRNRFEAQRAG